MAKQASTKKQKRTGDPAKDLAAQMEQAWLAGLGALSNAQEAGGEAFQALVKQGKSFSKDATDRTEALIEDVQEAIRDMSSQAQSRATGLIEQMRETPQLEKIQSAFDARVASALERIGVASKQSIDELNIKLDRVLKALDADKPAAKKVKRKTASKKAAPRKKAAKKKVSKVSRKKTSKKAA